MCGICGIFDMRGGSIDRELLARMNFSLRHRGPDGEGIYIDDGIGLGHRRLSIIDLGGGSQPIGNEDNSIQVIFNGEIYNYIELRNELALSGHKLKTNSDTEVIVHAYEEWGKECVNRFNGMFAFALWDSNNRTLLLARDHLGIKPLYYIQLGSLLLFASEIKALLEHPGCPRETDLQSLSELFTFRYVPSPKTLFRNIMKVPPGHTLSAAGGKFEIERYWNRIPQPLNSYNEADLIDEYQCLLTDAIRLQLRSDVPLGLFLSSGVDSGVLLAIMSQSTSGPVQTFTIGFEGGEDTNEIDDAKALANMFGAEHQYQILEPGDYAKYYDRYMGDIEEPVGNETAAAFYFVSQLTSKKVKVALNGQGADEPWAGYDRHRGAMLSSSYSRLPRILSRGLDMMVQKLPGRLERLKRGVSSLAEPDILRRFSKIYSFFSADMKSQLFKGALKSDFERDPYASRFALARLQSDVSHMDPLSQMLYIDTRSNLPDDLLMVGDKTSMACSLESRVPFLDVRLVEFIESLPQNLKIRRLTAKYLHKKACLKWLPKEIVYRQKKGFSNPIEHWFRSGMKSFVDDCLLSKDSSMANYFDQSYIQTLLKKDRQGSEQYRRHIYLLVSLELWYRRYIRR